MMRMMQIGLYPCQRMFDFPMFLLFFCDFLLFFVNLFKHLNLYYSVSRVLLRPLGGVIFMTVGFYYSVLPFVPL
jgi:hypothetical protein